MNELDRIKNHINILVKGLYELKSLNLYDAKTIEDLENKGLKEICDRSKHMIDDYVYTMHREISEDK